MNWFKFYGQEFLTDLKIKQLSVGHQLAWVYILCLASQNNGVIKYLDEHSLKGLMGLQVTDDNWTEIDGCLESFEALQMITISNKIVTVLRYGVRQMQNLSNAERQKKYRETHKIASKTVTDSNVTQSNDSNARIDKIRIDKNRLDNIHTPKKDLTEDELQEISDKYKIPIALVKLAKEEMDNWLEAKGKKYSNYKAGLRNWVLRNAKQQIEGRQNGKSRVSIDVTKI